MSRQNPPLRKMMVWYVLCSGFFCGLLYGVLALLWKAGWQSPQVMLLRLAGLKGLSIVLISAVHGLWLLALPALLTGALAQRLGWQNNLQGRAVSALVWTLLTAALYALPQLVGVNVLPEFNRLVAAILGEVMPFPAEAINQLMAAPPWYVLPALFAVGGWLTAMLVLPYEPDETWGDCTGERGEQW